MDISCLSMIPIPDVSRRKADVRQADIVATDSPPAVSPMWDGRLHSPPDWDALAQPEPEYVFDQQV